MSCWSSLFYICCQSPWSFWMETIHKWTHRNWIHILHSRDLVATLWTGTCKWFCDWFHHAWVGCTTTVKRAARSRPAPLNRIPNFSEKYQIDWKIPIWVEKYQTWLKKYQTFWENTNPQNLLFFGISSLAMQRAGWSRVNTCSTHAQIVAYLDNQRTNSRSVNRFT